MIMAACSGYNTFSTFSLNIRGLIQKKAVLEALACVEASTVLSIEALMGATAPFHAAPSLSNRQHSVAVCAGTSAAMLEA